MTYPIQKGIPLPPKPPGGPAPRFPIRQMKPGDSFMVPSKDMQKHLAQAVRSSAKTAGVKVAIRKVTGGVRVWRVS